MYDRGLRVVGCELWMLGARVLAFCSGREKWPGGEIEWLGAGVGCQFALLWEMG